MDVSGYYHLCIGSELSEKQVKFAEDRLKKTIIPKKWFDWE